MTSTGKPNPRALALWAVVVALLVGQVAVLWPHSLDDSFITARYAQNWVAGEGLSFNPGERVEGFSNFLLIVLLAPAAVIGLPLLAAAKGIGVLAALTLVALFYRVGDPVKMAEAEQTRFERFDSQAGLLAAILVVADGTWVYHAQAGLETTLFACLVTALVLTYDRVNSLYQFVLYGLLVWLAALTRPEGAVAIVAVVSLAVKKRGRFWGVAVGVLALFGATVLARFFYFGAWAPNTYLAKPGIQNAADLAAGLQYLHGALWSGGGYVAVALAVGGMALARRWHAPTAFAVAAGAGFCVYSGGDWVLGGRFWAPYSAVLMWAAALGLCRLAAKVSVRPAVAVGILWLSVRLFGTVSFHRDIQNQKFDEAHTSAAHTKLARSLAARVPPKTTVLADEIGALGYYGGFGILDVWGLVDAEVARVFAEEGYNPYGAPRSPAEKYRVTKKVARILVARRPDLIVLDYRGAPEGPPDLRYAIPRGVVHVAKEAGYVASHLHPVRPAQPKSFLVLRRPDFQLSK